MKVNSARFFCISWCDTRTSGTQFWVVLIPTTGAAVPHSKCRNVVTVMSKTILKVFPM